MPGINAWEDDPQSTAAAEPVERPVPDLSHPGLGLSIVGRQPSARVYPTGTPGFRYWNAADSLARAVACWSRVVPGGARWHTGRPLVVDLDAGDDLNAYYDRQELCFFHATVRGVTVYSGESPDVLCHELGHALLDAIRPQLWNAASIEVASFHEAFADISAMLSALELPSVRDEVLAQHRRQAVALVSRLAPGRAARLGDPPVAPGRGGSRLPAQRGQLVLLPPAREPAADGPGQRAVVGAALVQPGVHGGLARVAGGNGRRARDRRGRAGDGGLRRRNAACRRGGHGANRLELLRADRVRPPGRGRAADAGRLRRRDPTGLRGPRHPVDVVRGGHREGPAASRRAARRAVARIACGRSRCRSTGARTASGSSGCSSKRRSAPPAGPPRRQPPTSGRWPRRRPTARAVRLSRTCCAAGAWIRAGWDGARRTRRGQAAPRTRSSATGGACASCAGCFTRGPEPANYTWADGQAGRASAGVRAPSCGAAGRGCPARPASIAGCRMRAWRRLSAAAAVAWLAWGRHVLSPWWFAVPAAGVSRAGVRAWARRRLAPPGGASRRVL